MNQNKKKYPIYPQHKLHFIIFIRRTYSSHNANQRYFLLLQISHFFQILYLILYIIIIIQQSMSNLQSQSQQTPNHSNSYSPNQEENENTPIKERKSRRDQTKKTYTDELQDDENDLKKFQCSDLNNVQYYRGGKVVKVLAERERETDDVLEYLCKFQNKSYLHLAWITLDQAKDKEIMMMRLTKRHRTQIDEKLKETKRKFGDEHFFNPAYTKIDRIMTSSVMFPFMHQKKGSEIAGKWSQCMMLVCSKLLNFQQNDTPFGIEHKMQITEEDRKTNKLSDSLILQHVINKVYLDKYENYEEIWKEIGKCLYNFERISQENQEFSYKVIKECAIFLYWQWHYLSLCRYKFYLQSLDFAKREKSPSSGNVAFTFNNLPINLQPFIQANIFKNEKIGQTPTNKEELQLLNPGKFSYKWLCFGQKKQEEYMTYNFEQIFISDFEKLNLNIEVDQLYFVKWCELDYDEVTWEKESTLKTPEKIAEFRNHNKLPNKKIRQKIEYHRNCQKALLAYSSREKKISSEEADKYRRKLYCHQYNKEPKQYGGEDIPIYKDYKILKPFQLQSLNWMIKSWCERRNCILADEMGLGKTIQAIAFLNHLHTFEDVIGPFLVIAPLSTLKQWRNEIELWSDFNCILYKGKASSRNLIQQYEFYHNFVTNEGVMVKYQKLPRFQVFLTNYETCISDFDIIKKIAFQHIILDEAHKIKNATSKISLALRQLPCTRYLLLTGTPIQNNTSEFWSLLNLIEPKKFSSHEEFKKQFGELRTVEDLAKFKEVLKPYILRRIKSDVEKSIPKLSQMVVDLELTKLQKTYYKGIMEHNKNKFVSGLKGLNLNNISVCLRECCNHPFLVGAEVEEEIMKTLHTEEDRMKTFINGSSKMLFVHKILQKCKQQKSKTLIFSQFLKMLDLLEEYCEHQNLKYEVLHGSINYEERQNRIDRFNKDPSVSVFIISTKAGGTGINLTAATNIIIYDSDWNPQNDIQAIARAHRIGQKKNVTVYRLITSNTYESTLYESAAKKLGIGLAIFENEFFKKSEETKMEKGEKSNEEMEKLMRNGYLAFVKNENEQKQFSIENASIEEILQQSTRPIEYTSNEYEFTKTKIASNDENINIDDPNFWEVALKNIQSPLQKLVKRIKNNMKEFTQIPEQRALMIETNQVFFSFIKEKISMTHFNAQDEKELKSFLEAIACSREFHRKYRKIANDWLEEMEKPSRRFNKLDIEEFKIVQPKLPRIMKKQKALEEKERPPSKIQKQKAIVIEEKEEEQLEIQGFCAFCERKRCSKYCRKLCDRMFHKICYDRYRSKNSTIPSKAEIEEFTQPRQQIVQKIEEKFECFECLAKKAKCFLCNELGEAIVLEKFIPSRKKAQNQNEKDKLASMIQGYSAEQKKKVYGCKHLQCSKFYHLHCLAELKDSLAFQIFKSQNTYQIRCPVHFCAYCKDKLSQAMICSCLRCPASYHKKKCRPLIENSILKLNNDVFICHYHMPEKELTMKKKEMNNDLKKRQRKRLKMLGKMEQLQDESKSQQIEEKCEEDKEQVQNLNEDDMGPKKMKKFQ